MISYIRNGLDLESWIWIENILFWILIDDISYVSLILMLLKKLLEFQQKLYGAKAVSFRTQPSQNESNWDSRPGVVGTWKKHEYTSNS